jgi:uncharacterized protein YycO
MKKILNILLPLLIVLLTMGCDFITEVDLVLKNGDVIFHTSKSSQSEFIQTATNSKLSHVGIIYIKKGKPYVFEAVEPVKLTPLSEWISRGENNNYMVYRSNLPLSTNELDKMYEYCLKQKGKPYDMKFQWDDNKIYCSELVWDAYNSIGIQLSVPKTFADFNMESPEIKKEVIRRYGNKFVQSEPVVSPQCLVESDYLYKIFSNY